MGKTKGFSKPKPCCGMPAPLEKLDRIMTTAARLEELMTEITTRHLPPQCYDLIKRMASMPPAIRLVVSLKNTLELMRERNVTNALLDGLTADERDALIAIDSSGMSMETRRTAHSLFYIEARALMIELFGELFRNVKACRKPGVLRERPLDK